MKSPWHRKVLMIFWAREVAEPDHRYARGASGARLVILVSQLRRLPED